MVYIYIYIFYQFNGIMLLNISRYLFPSISFSTCRRGGNHMPGLWGGVQRSSVITQTSAVLL